MSAYYTASGHPPGRWAGAGLAGLNDGRGITGLVDEAGMDRLFSLGRDPVTADALGKNWPVQKSTPQRIAARIAALPAQSGAERAAAIVAIETQERGRRMPLAVSGFDLTFTVPKSVSVVWALADPATQTRIANAHRAAVADCLHLLEAHALFTRIGSGGVAQVPVRGAVAAAFDHWDTRTGDPNLHTHLVLANKVQGRDGRWRSIDAKALYAATVAVSEVYDCLIADAVARDVGVNWSLRHRGERRSPAFEIDGISDALLAEFSTRSTQVHASLRELLAEFRTTKGRTPSRPEVIRLRQMATRKSRPAKQLRALPDLLREWRHRAAHLLPESVELMLTRVLHNGTCDSPREVDDATLRQLAAAVVDAVAERRSTWTRWNLIAEAARASKTLRLSSASARLHLVECIAELAIAQHCVQLTPPDLTPLVADFARTDGSSAFRRHRAEIFTSPQILAAEERLLAAATTTNAPRIAVTRLTRVVHQAAALSLADDQRAVLHAIAASGRDIDVLVGPAGSGKTRTLRALRAMWEAEFGPGTVVGLAPSATAARELADSLGIECENTAKWLHETTGPPAERGDPRYTVRASQLFVVDEASLAGTLNLDALTRQAQEAGAKLLLVGDHRQLSSVDAGGAFGLLASETRAVELTSLWRFENAWEATAGQQMRVGNPNCIDAYAARGRLHDGPVEAMAADAYSAWDIAIRNGRTALLIAADNATVADLNTQARNSRVRDGDVEPDGVRLHDETVAGDGDTIVTRRNRRDLRAGSGMWVRNGDLWNVTARHDDGSLTVRRTTRSPDSRPDRLAVRLPADYVRHHVELGYATTAHRAQGMTVDAAFAVLRPGMSRELAYVAMTRGRSENHAFIATDIPDLGYDGAPPPDQTGRAVLAQILATAGAQTSATQTLRALQDQATSLAQLAPIHETLVQAAQRQRWTSIIAASGLTAKQAEQVLASPAYGPLVAALRRVEHDGHPMHRVLPALVAAAPLVTHDDGADDVAPRDLGAILHHRVTSWHERATSPPDNRAGALIGGPITPAGQLGGDVPADQRAAIEQLEALMANRVEAVTRQLLQNPPTWLGAFGAPPSDPRRRRVWNAAVGAIAAYRDRYGTPEYGHPLGDADPADPNQRIARRRALVAIRRARVTTSRPILPATQQLTRNSPSL